MNGKPVVWIHPDFSKDKVGATTPEIALYIRLDEVIVVACKGSKPQNTLDRADVLGGPFTTMTFARLPKPLENINAFSDDKYLP